MTRVDFAERLVIHDATHVRYWTPEKIDGVSLDIPRERTLVEFEYGGERHLKMCMSSVMADLKTPVRDWFDCVDYGVRVDEDVISLWYHTLPQNITVQKRFFEDDGYWYHETAEGVHFEDSRRSRDPITERPTVVEEWSYDKNLLINEVEADE